MTVFCTRFEAPLFKIRSRGIPPQVVTSTQGAVSRPWNRCCSATAVGLSSGLPATDPAALFLAAGPGRCGLPAIAQTSLAPFPVVTSLVVSDWVYDGFESFGAVTGAIVSISVAVVAAARSAARMLSGGDGPHAAARARGGEQAPPDWEQAIAVEKGAGSGGSGGDGGGGGLLRDELESLRREVQELRARLLPLQPPDANLKAQGSA